MRQITLGFDGGDALFQRLIVQIGDAAFDRGVKTTEAAFGIGQFGAQRRQTPGAIRASCVLPSNQTGEKIADAFRRQQPVGQPFGDQPVEFVHRDCPA